MRALKFFVSLLLNLAVQLEEDGMIVLQRLDAESGKLPCGCYARGTKVFSNGRELHDVVAVEAIALTSNGERGPVGRRDVVWLVTQCATKEDGVVATVEVNGRREIALARTEHRELELRCKHHPEYTA